MSIKLDLVCLGRIAVDLYGDQIGTPLEEARTFSRYLGGTSGNLAIGAARAGLKVGVVSRVGDDPNGRYLRRVLERENIDVSALQTDPVRRTALAFLGMRGAEAIGLDFYRDDPADMAIEAGEVADAYFSNVQTLAITGSHFVNSETASACFELVARAREAGCQIIFDIDYREGLWAAVDGGMDAARRNLSLIVEQADLLVGNVEEFLALTGEDELVAALRQVRSDNAAKLLVKLGPQGATYIAGEVPECRDDFEVIEGRSVDVLNPVGAGDAFLASFLGAWLKGGNEKDAVARATAAGALVVARHACSAAMPFKVELDHYMTGVSTDDRHLLHLHRCLARSAKAERIWALACDHREPFVELISETNRTHNDAEKFKLLVAKAARRVVEARSGVGGMLMDNRFGASVLAELSEDKWWVGRPLEVTGSRPIALEADPSLSEDIREWHPDHVAKILVWSHPDDDDALMQTQIETLRRVQASCNSAAIEWMLEIVPPLDIGFDDTTLIRSVKNIYEAGLLPDYWKLPVLTSKAAWDELQSLVSHYDSYCRGVVVLGLNQPLDALAQGLALAGRHDLCCGFAVGRTIFAEAANGWFKAELNDAQAVELMAQAYDTVISYFEGEETSADSKQGALV